MSNNSLPYLVDVTIVPPSASYDHSNNLVVTFTARWTTGVSTPDQIEIYRQFGLAPGLFDQNNRIASLPTEPSLVTLSIPAFDRVPTLYLGVAPRTIKDGTVTDTMDDPSGDAKSWDYFASVGFFTITYPSPRPSSGIPPPNLKAISITKTFTAGDQIDVTVIPTISPVDHFQIMVNANGRDQPQQDSEQPEFTFPSVPGVSYAVKAQQRGVNFNGDPWSEWCMPFTIVAKQRERSLRVFLANSGLLRSGTTISQYTQNANGSTRSMMGL